MIPSFKQNYLLNFFYGDILPSDILYSIYKSGSLHLTEVKEYDKATYECIKVYTIKLIDLDKYTKDTKIVYDDDNMIIDTISVLDCKTDIVKKYNIEYNDGLTSVKNIKCDNKIYIKFSYKFINDKYIITTKTVDNDDSLWIFKSNKITIIDKNGSETYKFTKYGYLSKYKRERINKKDKYKISCRSNLINCRYNNFVALNTYDIDDDDIIMTEYDYKSNDEKIYQEYNGVFTNDKLDFHDKNNRSLLLISLSTYNTNINADDLLNARLCDILGNGLKSGTYRQYFLANSSTVLYVETDDKVYNLFYDVYDDCFKNHTSHNKNIAENYNIDYFKNNMEVIKSYSLTTDEIDDKLNKIKNAINSICDKNNKKKHKQ